MECSFLAMLSIQWPELVHGYWWYIICSVSWELCWFRVLTFRFVEVKLRFVVISNCGRFWLSRFRFVNVLTSNLRKYRIKISVLTSLWKMGRVIPEAGSHSFPVLQFLEGIIMTNSIFYLNQKTIVSWYAETWQRWHLLYKRQFRLKEMFG